MVERTHLTKDPSGTSAEPWSVRRKEIVPAAPGRVWRALLEPEELCRWWCDFAEVDPRVGGTYTFSGRHVYGRSSPAAQRHDAAAGFEILDLVPESRLRYRWWLGGVETFVTYTLLNRLEQTEMSVIQSAERAPDRAPDPDMPDWWWVGLPALRSYVEKGRPDLRVDYEGLRKASEIGFVVDVSTFPWIIWHKLTNASELERWWARAAEVELRPGGPFSLGLGSMGPRTVIEVVEGRRLLHDWIWKDGTRGSVEWTIEETDEDVRLSLTDFGPRDPRLGPDAVSIYWAATLVNLKQMSERGIHPSEYQDPQAGCLDPPEDVEPP